MADRERKRAERQKRKARAVESTERRQQRAAASEAKNRAAREQLEPLEPEERPGIVTVGAIIAAVLAVSVIVVYISGAKVGTFDPYGNKTGEARPSVISAIVPAGLMAIMAVGMWRARYWAVLGFQALMALLVVATMLNIVAANDIVKALFNLALLLTASFLFYRMVKALARIQMPNR